MDIQTDPEQSYIAIPLPILPGSSDFVNYQKILNRIDSLLRESGIEKEFQEYALKKAEIQKGHELLGVWKIKAMRRGSLALRCNIARMLSQEGFRGFSVHLADSHLLQCFCLLNGPHAPKKTPSKSELQRFATEYDVDKIRDICVKLIEDASKEDGGACHETGLEKPVRMDVLLMDSTCIELNIHHPTDWVLLKDVAHSLLETIQTIRKHGLLHRMPDPKKMSTKANGLAMKMTMATRRGKGDKKIRKQTLRELKKLAKIMEKHGERYRDMLKIRWEETDLSFAQAKQFIHRIDNILEKIPVAIHQAHERIIGERKVKNNKKLLSLHESHSKVYKRGKAGADVEFGLQLHLGETMDGLIVDWELVDGYPLNDTKHIKRYLKRRDQIPTDMMPSVIVGDRGYDSKTNEKLLENSEIENMLCPRDPEKLSFRLGEINFSEYQKRRAQTEARIGIMKHKFIGPRMPAKGYERQNQHTAWAVLAHNLWVLARLPNINDSEKIEFSA